MTGVVRHLELSPDDLGNSLQGPQFGVVPLGLRSPEQNRCQLAQFVSGKLAFSSGVTNPRERFLSAGLPGAMPTAGRLPTDFQPAGDFRLRTSPGKQTPGLEPTLLFGRVIRATLRIPFHAGEITSIQSRVTTFCKDQ